MEITLKNLKVAQFRSEETLCYQADVCVDGKKVGTADNDGHGGCTHVRLDKNFKLETHTFSIPCDCSMGKNCILCKGTGIWKASLDNYCDYLADNMEKVKERTKLITKFTKQGFTYMVEFNGGYVATIEADETAVRAMMDKKYPNRTIKAIIKLNPPSNFAELEKEKHRNKIMNSYRKKGFKFMVETGSAYIGSNRPTEAEVREMMATKYPKHPISAIITL
jgi:hypothetical protein